MTKKYVTYLNQLTKKNNMSEIKVSKNITITIKGQTFILSNQEATELFNKLKDAGVNDHTIKYPMYSAPHTDWPAPFVPSTPYPSTPVWCTIETTHTTTPDAFAKFFGKC
jgi:hypothetical protein